MTTAHLRRETDDKTESTPTGRSKPVLRDVAYGRIMELLLNGQLKPGLLVSQRELCERTDTSIGAMRALLSTGSPLVCVSARAREEARIERSEAAWAGTRVADKPSTASSLRERSARLPTSRGRPNGESAHERPKGANSQRQESR